MPLGKSIEIHGERDVRRILDEILPRHANNLLRATVHGMAGQVAKWAKGFAPKGDTGRLRKAIRHRRRKSRPSSPISEVYVNRGLSRGDPAGAFYWHFVEYGTDGDEFNDGQAEQPFIRPAKVQFHRDKGRIMSAQFTKKLQSKIKREQKKARARRR